MARLVHLSEEAYGRLQNIKGSGESFSDVVLRLAPAASLADLGTGRSDAQIRAHEREIRAISRRDRPRG